MFLIYHYREILILMDFLGVDKGAVKSVTNKRVKIKKSNEFNKPSLTHSQISILFTLLKDKKIICNRDLDKSDYAEIINRLTFYSKQTIRSNLSKNNLILISAKKEDYEAVIVSLEKIVSDLRQYLSKNPAII